MPVDTPAPPTWTVAGRYVLVRGYGALVIGGAVATYVYIDGFNLFYGCLKGSAYKWLDLEALCRRLLPSDDIQRIRYFTAIVEARDDDPQKPQRQQTYLRALRTLPTVSVHLGHFLSRPTRLPLANPPTNGPRTAKVIRTEEKGSDVNLASLLLADGFNGRYDTAVVITNDSDLKLPIEIVMDDLGRKVGIVNPHKAHKRSRVLQGTFFKQLRVSAVRQSQLPVTLTDAQGPFTRPSVWSP